MMMILGSERPSADEDDPRLRTEVDPGLANGGGAGGVRGGNYDMTMDWWTDDSADWAMSGRMMKLTDGDMS